MSCVVFGGRRSGDERDWAAELEADLARLEADPEEFRRLLDPGTHSRQSYPDPTPLRPERHRDQGHERKSGLNQRSRTYLSAVATLIGLLMFFLIDPGGAGTAIRSAIGLDQRLLGEVDPGDSDSYAFLDTLGNGDPVTWSPCQPIEYEVNPEGAPTGWESLITESADKVSEASGLSLEYLGTSDSRAFADEGASRAGDPVLIGFADAAEVPRLAGDVAGLGGPITRVVGVSKRYVGGSIVLDSDLFSKLATPRGSAEKEAIVMHEMGHLLGLGHVDDTTQLMHAENVGRTDFGAGDLTGLALLGQGRC